MHPSYNEPLDLETLKINPEIYNKKFSKQDGNNISRSIVVLGKPIQNPLDSLETQASHEDIIANIKNIKLNLEEGQYIGLLYAPYKKEHVESFIISKDNILITAQHNLNSKLRTKIETSFPSGERKKLDTSGTVKNPKTGFSEVRVLQADDISCGAIALKTLKTLLSRKEDGKLLIESLPIKKGNIIDMPPDILKISQSQALVDKKTQGMLPKELNLSVGKYANTNLNAHRLKFSRILNDENKSNIYVEQLRQKYNEIGHNPEMQKKKIPPSR